MKINIKDILIQIGIETLCFIIIGILLLGYFVIIPNNTGFSYTIFGFSAIIFYQLLVNSNIKSYVLLGMLFSIFIIIILKTNNNVLVFIRNLCWFLFIGVMIYYLSYIGKKNWFRTTKLWIIVSWFIGFVSVYILMTLMNIYIFEFYKTNHQLTTYFYLKQAFKIGGILGIGIGFGNLISLFFIDIKENSVGI
ncbi:MAG: hypothetical protein WCE54_06800 [Ignavibacteriaceae bacterium]